MDIKAIKYEQEQVKQENIRKAEYERSLQNHKANILNSLEERQAEDQRREFEKVVEEIKYTENVDAAEVKKTNDL